MRLGLLLLPLASIALIAGGGYSIYSVMERSRPSELTLADIGRPNPPSGWLQITGGRLDATHAMLADQDAPETSEMAYVPLVRADSAGGGKIRAVVRTRDAAILRHARQMAASGNVGTAPAEMKAAMERPISGLARAGFHSPEEERLVRRRYPELADRVLLIDEGVRPSIGGGVFALLGGMVLGALVLLAGRKPADSRRSDQ